MLVLDHYAAREAKDGCLDPPPLQKWAEEGFAVVQVWFETDCDGSGHAPGHRGGALSDGHGEIVYGTQRLSFCSHAGIRALVCW